MRTVFRAVCHPLAHALWAASPAIRPHARRRTRVGVEALEGRLVLSNAIPFRFTPPAHTIDNACRDQVGTFRVVTPFFHDQSPPGAYDFTLSQNGDTRVPVPSPLGGTVVFAGQQNGYGNVVYVRYPNGLTQNFAHLDSINVQAGQVIGQGQPLGIQGSTGNSTGPHVHTEIGFFNPSLKLLGRIEDRSKTEPFILNYLRSLQNGGFRSLQCNMNHTPDTTPIGQTPKQPPKNSPFDVLEITGVRNGVREVAIQGGCLRQDLQDCLQAAERMGFTDLQTRVIGRIENGQFVPA
jgi:hypothetical protein